MASKSIPLLIFAVALLAAGFFNVLRSPSAAGDLAGARRENLARQYLQVKNSPDMKTGLFGDGPTRRESLLKNLEDRSDKLIEQPRYAEAIAIVLYLEDRRETAVEIAKGLSEPIEEATSDEDAAEEEISPTKRFQPLRFALHLEDGLDTDWETLIEDDWFGAQLKILVYSRFDQSQELSNARLQARVFETRLENQDFYFGMFNVMGIFGLGLLFSLLMSARYYKLAGKRFYRLAPLFLPRDHLLHFCGWFLLGFVIVAAISQTLLSGLPGIYNLLVTYLLQIGWGLAVLRHFLFRGDVKAIFRQLGWADLRMKFMSLFQILGGFCILIALGQLAAILMQVFSWPNQPPEVQETYAAMLQEPVSMAILLIVTCMLAPIFEEAVFRGLIFRGMLSWGKPAPAFLISAALFAVVHPVTLWPMVFTMGLGLALVYYRTANILVCIWAHALFNLLSLLLMTLS